MRVVVGCGLCFYNRCGAAGLEVAGTVAHVGARVTQWKVGDSVCALTNGGGYAEYVNDPG